MPRYCLRLFLLCAALFLTGGCATALTLDAMDPGEEEDESDYIADVRTAWRDEAGNVTLCVAGMPAGGNYWLGGTRNYTVAFPAAASPVLKVFYHEAIPQYHLTAADVKGTCPNAGEPLPIHTVRAEEFAKEPGGKSWSGMSDAALTEFFETRAEAPAIYKFLYNPSWGDSGADLMNVVYVSEEPVFRQTRAIEIATDFRKVEGRPAYAMLLPFAVVFDIVMFPVQLLAVLSAHG